jgi:hypothetical protein
MSISNNSSLPILLGIFIVGVVAFILIHRNSSNMATDQTAGTNSNISTAVPSDSGITSNSDTTIVSSQEASSISSVGTFMTPMERRQRVLDKYRSIHPEFTIH